MIRIIYGRYRLEKEAYFALGKDMLLFGQWQSMLKI
jgi:hypothetical protein